MSSIRRNQGFHSRGRNLLLIGTPGTGKRPVAGYLVERDDFVHLDFEDGETRAFFLDGSNAELRERLAQAADPGHRIVITWAAGPPSQLRDLRRLRSLGIEPVWFDSDRGTAYRAHFADARRVPRCEFMDTFEPDGQFRPVEAVARELLEPRTRNLPGSELAAAARERVALAGAALVGVAAAALVVLAGVGAYTERHPAGAAAVASSAPPAQRIPALPHRGVLVSGKSLAGVQLGDSMAAVKALWGGRFTRCDTCKPAMWFYWYPPPADPQGAGVQFANGHVVAVFTLGSPAGWRTETGIRVGQILDNPTTGSGSRWLTCAGYSASSTETTPNAVTSILTQGSAVYGFALTRPSVSPCH